LLALIILFPALILIGIYLSADNSEGINGHFSVTEDGVIAFKGESANYQLLASSRLSFVGCWLKMIELDSLFDHKTIAIKASSRELFIFKDSLSGQDFARLLRVIKGLG